MTQEEFIEAAALNMMLTNSFLLKSLKRDNPETLERMYNRSTLLDNKIINHYKLPTTLINNPVTDFIK